MPGYEILPHKIYELTKSLNQFSAAANETAAASGRYASRLVWATWALVAVTVGLAATPLSEHFYPTQTGRQLECRELATWVASQSPEARKGADGEGPWDDY